MRRFLVAYVATAVPFLALDAVWLSTAMQWLYAPRIGPLLLAQPRILPALLFYALYVVGVVVFAVLPASRAPAGSGAVQPALGLGALLGVVAYGTYDMTNLATLQGWSTLVTVADMVWGAVVTGAAAALGALATSRLATSRLAPSP